MKIILASQSPRRKDFLQKMGIEFEVVPSQCPEVVDPNIKLEQMALHFAKQKAREVFEATQGDRLVIGCDTAVVLDGQIYGKPKDEDDAFRMIKSYCGTCNLVVSGLCVIVQRGDIVSEYNALESTKVFVKQMTDQEIWAYIKTGEPFGKAGAYALQGKFNVFVDKVEGNVSSVVGLPTNKLLDVFREEGIQLFAKVDV